MTAYPVILRSLVSLDGLLSGIIADGVVNDSEIQYLEMWLDTVDTLDDLFPFSMLIREITAITEDGVIDPAERRRLQDLIRTFTEAPEERADETLSTVLRRIPLDTPLAPTDLHGLHRWVLKYADSWSSPENLTDFLQLVTRIFEDMVLTPDELMELENRAES